VNDDDPKGDDKTKIGAIATIANSKAADKLADAVKGLVQLPHNALDYLVGPDRIRAVGEARREVAISDARTQAEIERIRAETGEFVLDREMRKTVNREAILAEAQKALPPPGTAVADEPVSKDFVHAFFEEFDGISDPEVHKIVGRLLAGEVVRPGSFPRRTMRVLRDLESSDFAQFASLCRFVWIVGEPIPIVFEPNDPIYLRYGMSFSQASELATLGLVSFGGIAGYSRKGFPKRFTVAYGSSIYKIEMKEGVSELGIGKVIFTEAGRRLAQLTNATAIPDFGTYVIEKWRADGHEAYLSP
jgi:hypothetical protein